MRLDVPDLCSSHHDSKLLCTQEVPAKSQSSDVRVSGRCERLSDFEDCKKDVWAVLQKMFENAHSFVVRPPILFTQWLIVVTLLFRLAYRDGIDCNCCHGYQKCPVSSLM